MMDLSFYNNGHKEVFYEKGLMERPIRRKLKKEPKHPSVVVSVIRVAQRITEGCFCNHINCFLAISDTKSISSLAGSTNGSTSVSISRI